MIVFLQDRFVPEEEATVSIFDRGFLYGDGLFETIRVHAGRPFLWSDHVERLWRGARVLRLDPPVTPEALLAIALELLDRNQLPEALLRVALSRGRGPRGYSPRGALHPTLAVTTHPAVTPAVDAPPTTRLRISSHRVPTGDPLASIKNASKLLHILARAEAEDLGADEALLLNAHGDLAEAAAANVFWFDAESLHTPPLAAGALAGVMRGFVLRQLAPALGFDVHESAAPASALREATGAFLTLCSQGIVEVTELDGAPLARDPRTRLLRSAYVSALARG